VTSCRPSERKISQAEFAADRAQGAQLVSRRAGGRPGPLAVGLHRAARLPGRVLGPRPGLGRQLDREEPRGSRRSSKESGLVDLDMDYQVGMPELRIVPDRARAADLGVSVEDVATRSTRLVGGLRIGKYRRTGGASTSACACSPTSARARRTSRGSGRSASGELVPLSSLVTTEEQPALQAITRQRPRARDHRSTRNVAPGHSQADALEVRRGARDDLPTGYRLVLGGLSVAFRESMGEPPLRPRPRDHRRLHGPGFAVQLVPPPDHVLTILPLSVAGAAFALLATGQSLNIFSMIGLLLLMGIVKKNSIILVDYANQQSRRAGPRCTLNAMLRRARSGCGRS
jgi:multidrug efflux pump